VNKKTQGIAVLVVGIIVVLMGAFGLRSPNSSIANIAVAVIGVVVAAAGVYMLVRRAPTPQA
jgi:hypothetical protein